MTNWYNFGQIARMRYRHHVVDEAIEITAFGLGGISGEIAGLVYTEYHRTYDQALSNIICASLGGIALGFSISKSIKFVLKKRREERTYEPMPNHDFYLEQLVRSENIEDMALPIMTKEQKQGLLIDYALEQGKRHNYDEVRSAARKMDRRSIWALTMLLTQMKGPQTLLEMEDIISDHTFGKMRMETCLGYIAEDYIKQKRFGRAEEIIEVIDGQFKRNWLQMKLKRAKKKSL